MEIEKVTISKNTFPTTILRKVDYGIEISFGNNFIPFSKEEAERLLKELKRLLR